MSFVTIDFETEAIVVGSATPPKPIGVAIKKDDGCSFYYSFGHVGQNGTFFRNPDGTTGFLGLNDTGNLQRAKEKLSDIALSGAELVFHNAKFDLRVMKTWFGIEITDCNSIHDTMLLLFLYDPNQKRLGLKESAERLLGIKPAEKESLKDYMVSNQEELGVKISKGPKKDSYYMKMLKYAPADIVGAYACNDVEITYALFVKLYLDRVKDNLEK